MMDFAQTWGILFSHPNSPPTIFGWAINSSLYRDPAFYLPIGCYTGTRERQLRVQPVVRFKKYFM